MLLPLILAITLPPAAWTMIFLSLGFGTGLVGAMYVVAYFLQSPPLIALAKEELAALLFSVIIIFFWISFDSTLNGLVQGALQSTLSSAVPGLYTGNAGPGQFYTSAHISLALGVLDIIKAKLLAQYTDLYLFEALIGFLSTISFPIGSPVPSVAIISFSFSPFTGLTLLSDAHTVVVETIGYLITVLMAKEFILLFVRDALPILLLPLGLILRAFPFFRSTGSSILAICFAMYFVLPLSIILSHYLIFGMFKPADFVYNPQSESLIGGSHDQSYWKSLIDNMRGSRSDAILKQFDQKDSLADTTKGNIPACGDTNSVGEFVSNELCSVKNIFSKIGDGAKSFAQTIFGIWGTMVGLTGDFYPSFFGANSTFLPSSSSAGLYFYILTEVGTISPFIVLVILTTVLEIIITVTMYRSISLLIGGEAELVGLTKIV